MPSFRYEASDVHGKLEHGLLDADTDRGVRAQLRARGLFPLFIDIVAAQAAGMRRALFAPRLTDAEPAWLTRRPASLLAPNLTPDAAQGAIGALSELLEHASRIPSRELERRALGADKDPVPARRGIMWPAKRSSGALPGAACATTRDNMAAPASTRSLPSTIRFVDRFTKALESRRCAPPPFRPAWPSCGRMAPAECTQASPPSKKSSALPETPNEPDFAKPCPSH